MTAPMTPSMAPLDEVIAATNRHLQIAINFRDRKQTGVAPRPPGFAQVEKSIAHYRTILHALEKLSAPVADRNAVIEECARVCDSMAVDADVPAAYLSGLGRGARNCAKAIRALVLPPEAVQPVNRLYWLIEWRGGDDRNGKWLQGMSSGEHEWTNNSANAIQFCNKESAQTAMRLMLCGQGATVTEHMDIGGFNETSQQR